MKPGHTSAAPVAQNHPSKPEDLTLQNATLSGNLRPDLLTSLMNMSLALRRPREMHLSRSSSNVPRLPKLLKLLQKPQRFAHFWQGTESPAPATQSRVLTSKSGPRPSPSKSAPKPVRCALRILTWKCASRQKCSKPVSF